MNQSVLLVEDDDALRDSLAQTLEIEGITVIATAQFAQARRVIRANFNGVVLTDIRMPGADGFDVLALARGVDEELPVVMLTGEADVPMAIRAMKEGAWEFLEKPCSTDRLLEVLGRALRARALALRSRASEQRLRRGDLAAVNFPGRSDASRDLRRALRAASEGRRPVVLTGPAGVGKKQAAHTLFHLMDTGGRFQAETVPLAGNFALAPDTRVLSLKRAERLGHDDAARLNAAGVDRANLRLIAATEGAVPGWIAARDPVEIAMPSLADRAPDVSVIFEELLRMAARNADRDMPPVTPDLLARVAGRDWPGHLAELRAFANEVLAQAQPAGTLTERMEAYEASVLADTLRRHGGKARFVAEELGLPRKTLYDRLTRHGLRPKDFKH